MSEAELQSLGPIILPQLRLPDPLPNPFLVRHILGLEELLAERGLRWTWFEWQTASPKLARPPGWLVGWVTMPKELELEAETTKLNL